MASFIKLLPAELHNAIRDLLDANDIKNLRATCSSLAKGFPLYFNRVFISANSLNIEVFNAIANHETFRHQVTEIVWDDARLRTGQTPVERRRLRSEEDYHDAECECPRWFRYEYFVYPEPCMDNKESWSHYQQLVKDQTRILSSNADIKAFKYGLKRFTSLQRVIITPSTHGRLGSPLYRTPMIRAFPPGFLYPLPKAWASINDDSYDDVFPWVHQNDNACRLGIYGSQVTAEDYKNNWRGFRLVTRALVEYDDHHISELVIGGNEVLAGLNYLIFDKWSQEYSDFVAILKRPGFRYLDLHLLTSEDARCYRNVFNLSLLYDALAQAKDLEYLSLHTSTEMTIELPSFLNDRYSLRTIFSPESWPRLRHFGISGLIMKLDDLINLLASMPPTLRCVELTDVVFEPSRGYNDLLRAMRDFLDWRSRPAEERPEVQLSSSILDAFHEKGMIGRYITMSVPVYSCTGNDLFENPSTLIEKGRGAVWRDTFDPDFEVPF